VSHGGMILTGEHWKNLETNLSQWTDTGMNPGLNSEKPVINHKHATAISTTLTRSYLVQLKISIIQNFRHIACSY
jgi:hypothetical protein